MDKSVFRDADLILSLDTRDWESHPRHRPHQAGAPSRSIRRCEMIEIGFGDIGLSKWSMDYTRMPNCSLRVLGDTATAIPELTRLCRERIARDAGLAERIAGRSAEIGTRHDALFAKWASSRAADWDACPIALPRLAHELWDVIKTEDWVLTACTLQDWALNCGISTGPTATPAARSAPGPRSACRSASPSLTAAPDAWWSTSSPTATSCSTPAHCGRRQEQNTVPDRDVQQPRLLQ